MPRQILRGASKPLDALEMDSFDNPFGYEGDDDPNGETRILPVQVVDKASIRDSDDDDDDDNVDGSGSSRKRVSTKKVRRKPRKCEYTVHSKSLTAKEKDAELAKLAQVNFAASSANGLKWQKAGSNVYRRKLNGDVQQMKCALASSNCCEYRLRVVQKRDCGDRCFEIHLGDWEHADHKTMMGKVGPAPAVRQMMTPLHLDSRPGDFVREARRVFKDAGMYSEGLTKKELGKLKSFHTRKRDSYTKANVSGVRVNQIGGLRQILLSMRETELAESEDGFDFDTPYLVGGEFLVETIQVAKRNSRKAESEDDDHEEEEEEEEDGAESGAKRAKGGKGKKKKQKKKGPLADTTKLAFVLSTKNLLANIWRQQARGSSPNLSLDTTYRVMVEGFGLTPIGVTGRNQTWHPVGFGIISTESAECIEFCLKMIKGDIEHLVRSFAAKKMSL